MANLPDISLPQARRIMESIPGLACVKDPSGQFLAISGEYADLLSAEAAKQGVAASDVYAPREVRRFCSIDNAARAAQRPFGLLEPPDSAVPSWVATLKIPITVESQPVTLSIAFPLATAAWLPDRCLTEPGFSSTADRTAFDAYRHAGGTDRLHTGVHRGVGEIAVRLGKHRRHVARCFTGLFGTSLGTYMRAKRIAWAARCLAATEAPIAELALDAGFYDQAHFTRAFREMLGLPPATYRAACRKGALPLPSQQLQQTKRHLRRMGISTPGIST